MLKKLLFVFASLFVAGVAYADVPFALSAKVEHVWSKLDVPQKDGAKQYDSDVQVTLTPSIRLRPDIFLVGGVTYPVRSRLPEYSIGLEFAIYGQK